MGPFKFEYVNLKHQLLVDGHFLTLNIGVARCIVVLLGLWNFLIFSVLVKTLLYVVECQLHVVWLNSALACVLSICSLT